MEPTRGEGLGALPEPSALLFDLDGTLVDTVPVRIEAWLRAFREAGIPASPDLVAGQIGSDGKRLARTVAAASGRQLDEAEADRLDRESGRLHEELNRHPRPLPGATALLAALEASSVPHAIATSSLPAQVHASVDALGLARRPIVVDGGHVEHAKPAPDLLLVGAERLGCPPAACWYVGDATWDMLAAKAARMIAIGVPTGAVDGAALAGSGADAVVPDLGVLHRELARRGLVTVERGDRPRHGGTG